MTKEFKNKTHEELTDKMIDDRELRVRVTSQNPYWFFLFYFSEYIQYELSDMHREMLRVIGDRSIKLSVITAFRGSGKSTLFTTLAPIWSVLGDHQCKFVVIASQTKNQAKQHFSNLKKELENNKRLKRDLGPFEDKTEKWGQYGIYLPKYDARIMAVSREQSIRGIRHGANRPDLIICDDIEDLNSVKTRDSRNKTYNWFKGDLLPAGDRNTRTIVVGTPLHDDCLVKRLEEEIESGDMEGRFLKYPIVDDQGKSTWPGKYPNKDLIEKEKKKIGNDLAWQREYMLNIVPEADQIIHRDWISYYDNLPNRRGSDMRYVRTLIGIDLAISKEDYADYTAMVAVDIYRKNNQLRFFVHPNPVNEKLDFAQTLDKSETLSDTVKSKGKDPEFIIEDVGYQKANIQQLRKRNRRVKSFNPGRQGKRSKLSSTSSFIKEGQVKFPKQGAERLIDQIVGFGKEKHDDLMDAFVMAILKGIEEYNHRGVVIATENPWKKIG